MGHNNNNMGTTWAQKYNKGVAIVTIRGYTNSIGPNIPLSFKNVLFSMLE